MLYAHIRERFSVLPLIAQQYIGRKPTALKLLRDLLQKWFSFAKVEPKAENHVILAPKERGHPCAN